MNPVIKDIWLTRLTKVLWVVVALAFIVVMAKLAVGQVRLDWTDSTSASVASYRVSYGQTSRVYTASALYPKTVAVVTISNLPPAPRWYFTVSAVATNGLESDLSNEVVWTNANFGPPITLRLTGPVSALELQSSSGAGWTRVGLFTNTVLQMEMKRQQMLRGIRTNLPPPPPR